MKCELLGASHHDTDRMTLTAVSLFSGAGGFCEGMRLAGWKIACAVEADCHACLTHAANFDDVALFKGTSPAFFGGRSTWCH
jgi:DNA (cytosine-5)-methyltransferase 1